MKFLYALLVYLSFLATYWITSYTLKSWGDGGRMVRIALAIALPLLVLEFWWVGVFHYGGRCFAKWSVYVIGSVAGVTGGTLSMWLFFGEKPNPTVLAGLALAAGGGILVTLGEAQKAVP